MNTAQLARFRKISDIAHRYSINVLAYLRENLNPIELDEYWKVTPVPVSVYAKQV